MLPNIFPEDGVVIDAKTQKVKNTVEVFYTQNIAS